MSKIKNGGLDQYGAEPFEQQLFGTAGVEGVNSTVCACALCIITSFVYYTTVLLVDSRKLDLIDAFVLQLENRPSLHRDMHCNVPCRCRLSLI